MCVYQVALERNVVVSIALFVLKAVVVMIVLDVFIVLFVKISDKIEARKRLKNKNK